MLTNLSYFEPTDCVLHSYPRSKEEEIKTKNVWLKGHWYADDPPKSTHAHLFDLYYFGIITILYSQPVAALQILTKVKHLENALVGIVFLKKIIFIPNFPFFISNKSFFESKRQVINAGDALEFLSREFYRATIHRYYLFLSRTPK
jgi:isopenicillin N synthase-like dioxygenase